MTLFYLATVYSIHEAGLDKAFSDALECLGKLTIAGYHVYSPIVHNHYLNNLPGLEKFDWLEEDSHQLNKCDALIVYKMPKWEKSKGIHYEIGYMKGQNKRIKYLDYPLTPGQIDSLKYGN